MADRRVAVVPAEAVSGTAAARRYPEEVAAEWARRASTRRIRNSSSHRRRSSMAMALRRATEVHLHRRCRVDMAQEAPHRRRMRRLEVTVRRLTFSSSSDLDIPVQSAPRHRRARRSMATTAPRRSLSRPVTPARRTVSLSPKVRMSFGLSCSENLRVRSRGSDGGLLAAAPATQAQRPAFRARLPHTSPATVRMSLALDVPRSERRKPSQVVAERSATKRR